MKLLLVNKTTGRVAEYTQASDGTLRSDDDTSLPTYRTLSQLAEDWEMFMPQFPRPKDGQVYWTISGEGGTLRAKERWWASTELDETVYALGLCSDKKEDMSQVLNALIQVQRLQQLGFQIEDIHFTNYFKNGTKQIQVEFSANSKCDASAIDALRELCKITDGKFI